MRSKDLLIVVALVSFSCATCAGAARALGHTLHGTQPQSTGKPLPVDISSLCTECATMKIEVTYEKDLDKITSTTATGSFSFSFHYGTEGGHGVAEWSNKPAAGEAVLALARPHDVSPGALPEEIKVSMYMQNIGLVPPVVQVTPSSSDGGLNDSIGPFQMHDHTRNNPTASVHRKELMSVSKGQEGDKVLQFSGGVCEVTVLTTIGTQTGGPVAASRTCFQGMTSVTVPGQPGSLIQQKLPSNRKVTWSCTDFIAVVCCDPVAEV